MTVTDFSPPWFQRSEVMGLVEVFARKGARLCFFGGAVRDSVAGGEPIDFDMLVSPPLRESTDILQNAGMRVLGLNEEFRCIKSHVKHIPVDFQVLSEDVSPPDLDFIERAGRHMAHPSNSDFTFNALYLTPEGKLFDNTGGVDDLHAGIVRFIHDPLKSVTSSPVRIVRFFRFYAWYGKGAPDAAAVEACMRIMPQLGRVPGHKMMYQFMRLLDAPFAAATLRIMHEWRVLDEMFGFAILDCSKAANMERIEALLGKAPDARLRFAMLLIGADIAPPLALEHLTYIWDQQGSLNARLGPPLKLLPYMNRQASKAVRQSLLARLGKEHYQSLLLMSWASEEDVETAAPSYRAMLDEAA